MTGLKIIGIKIVHDLVLNGLKKFEYNQSNNKNQRVKKIGTGPLRYYVIMSYQNPKSKPLNKGAFEITILRNRIRKERPLNG